MELLRNTGTAYIARMFYKQMEHCSVEGFRTIAERSRRVGRTKSDIKPARMRQSLPRASHDQELVLEDKGLRNYRTDAARTEQAGQGSKEMDKKNDQIAHRRIVAGREILRKYGKTTIRQPHAHLEPFSMPRI
jgi:hypothetical protein